MTLYAAGANADYNLGLGHNTATPTPTVAAGEAWKKIAVSTSYSGEFSLAIKTDGTLWGVGFGGENCLGLPITTYTTWTQIGSATDWADIATGAAHSLAIKTDGTLWATGSNNDGACGTGNTAAVTTWTQIGSATDWATVYAGYYSSFAIKTDGTLWAWGYNSADGLLGLDTTTTIYTSPQQVGSEAGWASVAYKKSHVVGRKTDWTLWAWGQNTYGQLGLGNTTTPIRAPQQIGVGLNWQVAMAGEYTTHCLATDGTLWACGDGSFYALGTGDTANQSSLTQIGSDADWTAVAAGFQYLVLLKADGSVHVVGRNTGGQLGTGNTADVTSITPLGLTLESAPPPPPPLGPPPPPAASIPAVVVSAGYATFFLDAAVASPEPVISTAPSVYRLSALIRDAGAPDFPFRLSSLGLTKRSGATSYYAVSAQYSDALIGALNARPDAVIHLLRDDVDWESFNPGFPVGYDIGPRSASITLNGTRQETIENPVSLMLEAKMVVDETVNSDGHLVLGLVPGYVDPRPTDVILWRGIEYAITRVRFQAGATNAQTLSITAVAV